MLALLTALTARVEELHREVALARGLDPASIAPVTAAATDGADYATSSGSSGAPPRVKKCGHTDTLLLCTKP